MTERLPDDVSRRTVLRATGIAAAGSAGLAGVASAGSSSTQTDDFTLVGKNVAAVGGGTTDATKQVTGDIETVRGKENAEIDIEKIVIHSVNESAETAVVSVAGTATNPGGQKVPIRSRATRQTVPINVSSRNAMLLSANQCPGDSQEELITLTLEDLNLNVLGLVVFIDNIDLAICCEPGLLLGDLLCGLLVTE